MITLAIGGSLVGGDNKPLQKFGDALLTFTMLNGLPASLRLKLSLLSPEE